MQIIFSTKTLILCTLLILIIGFFLGFLSFLLFGNIAGNCRVVFVTTEALVSLEKRRIAGSTDPLFFGKPEAAIQLMTKYLSRFENKRTKVLFVSSETGVVKGGIDISPLIYDAVMQEMNKANLTGN